MKKTTKVLFKAIIAIVAVIGFSFAACGAVDDDGGGSKSGNKGGGDPLANQLSGTWKTGDGETVTLTNGSFVITQNDKPYGRGTYTASARSISANISLAVKELHGDILTEEMKNEGIDKTFESKWYTKDQFIDAFKKILKELGASDAQITAYLNEHSGDLNAMYPTITGTIDGDTMFLNVGGGTTYIKDGGSTNPGTNPGTGGGSLTTWTTVTDSTFGTSTISGIAYGNNKFVAVGRAGKLAYSSDGVTWTAVTPSPFDTNTIGAIAYGSNKFITVGDSGTMTYSTDGTTWTAITPSPFGTTNIGAIAYGNGTFVAVGSNGKMATSTDGGVTWTAANFNSIFNTLGTLGKMTAIAYVNNKFVAMGRDDDINGIMATSINGTTWTAVTDSSVKSLLFNIDEIAYGNNTFIAVGGVGKMATSTNGTSWTAVTNSTFGTSGIYAIAYDNNKFVIGGDSGKIAYSTGN